MLKEFEEFFHICFGNQDWVMEYKIKKKTARSVYTSKRVLLYLKGDRFVLY